MAYCDKHGLGLESWNCEKCVAEVIQLEQLEQLGLETITVSLADRKAFDLEEKTGGICTRSSV